MSSAFKCLDNCLTDDLHAFIQTRQNDETSRSFQQTQL